MKNGSKFIIGIDLGGTNLKLGLFDTGLKLKFFKNLNTAGFNNQEHLIQGIADATNEIIALAGLGRKDILGAGIGFPGPVDTFGGLVHFLPNIKGWKDVKVKSILEKKIKVKVFIDNDAKLMGLAEYKLADRKIKNALCITLGTGVGGAIILEGKLYRGMDNAAGEIGHFPINESGPVCNCGGSACLESYIGNSKIIALGKQAFGSGITLEDLSVKAKQGNQKAIAIWNKVGLQLGVALSGVVNLLNLDAIIVGGGVAQAGEVLFKKVRETIVLRSMSVHAKRVKLFKAKLGNRAGIFGAAILVKERLTPTSEVGVKARRGA